MFQLFVNSFLYSYNLITKKASARIDEKKAVISFNHSIDTGLGQINVLLLANVT